MIACLFCQIAAGEQPASIIFEDAHTLAFMNIRQANPGHVLVIPRAHIETIYELDDATASRLLPVISRVTRAIRESLRPEGLTIFQANGAASWQEIPHLHIHLFPRRQGDGFLRYYPEQPPFCPRSELDLLAGLISSKM